MAGRKSRRSRSSLPPLAILLAAFVASPLAAAGPPRPAYPSRPIERRCAPDGPWTLDQQDLPFRGRDGTRLHGTLVERRSFPPRGALLLLPGLFTRRNLEDARRLADLGLAVLAVDFRGHGPSRGTWDMDEAVHDVGAALRAIRRHDGGRLAHLPLFAFGKSAGGLVLNRARPLCPELRAIVVVAAPFDLGRVAPGAQRRLRRLARPRPLFDLLLKGLSDTRRLRAEGDLPAAERWTPSPVEEAPVFHRLFAWDLRHGFNVIVDHARISSPSGLVRRLGRGFALRPATDGLYLFADGDALTRDHLPRIRKILAHESNEIRIVEGFGHNPDPAARRRYARIVLDMVEAFLDERALPDLPLLDRMNRPRLASPHGEVIRWKPIHGTCSRKPSQELRCPKGRGDRR